MRRLLPLVLTLAACTGGEPPEPTVFVPESWKAFRKGVGHVDHLNEGVKCRDCHSIEGSGFQRPTLLVCDECHAEVRDRMHLSSEAPNDDCYSCHPFKEKTEVGKGRCKRCHEIALPIHDGERCISCHAPHRDPPIAIERCSTCHEEKEVVATANVHGTIQSEVEGCRACHVGHQPKEKAAGTCDRCHEEKAPARNVGHDTCVKCHVPHGQPRTCRSCHAKVRKDRHERCTTCHDPHRPERRAAAECAECHNDVLVQHGAGATDCTGCHQPHRSRKACSSCHRNAPADQAFHAGGTRCSVCHEPHGFTRSTARACGTCHGEIVVRTSRRPGHDDCAGCHPSANHFAKRPPKACAACHQEQHRTAPEGHRECMLCHEPHSGVATRGKDCVACHDRPADIHTKAGRCQTCHAVHGAKAKPPACQSCHSVESGLHLEEGHGECRDCHQPHVKYPRRDRGLCDRCHDLPDHEPEVTTCVGCHPFR